MLSIEFDRSTCSLHQQEYDEPGQAPNQRSSIVLKAPIVRHPNRTDNLSEGSRAAKWTCHTLRPPVSIPHLGCNSTVVPLLCFIQQLIENDRRILHNAGTRCKRFLFFGRLETFRRAQINAQQVWAIDRLVPRLEPVGELPN